MQPLNSFLNRQITRRYSSQRRGQNRSGNEPDGGIFWPSSKHIDPARLTPQILLVKDHGVYLITNASLDGTPVSRDTVVYARGMNPSVDDEWYDEAEEALGGDDSSVSIPVAWFELALKKKFNAFSIKVSPTKITLVNG